MFEEEGASYLEEADTSTVDENGIIEKTLEDVSEGEVREVAIRLVAGDASQQAAAQRSHGHTMGVESSLVPSRERDKNLPWPCPWYRRCSRWCGHHQDWEEWEPRGARYRSFRSQRHCIR